MPNKEPKRLAQCNDPLTRNQFIKFAHQEYEALVGEIDAIEKAGGEPALDARALDAKKERVSQLLELIQFVHTYASGLYEKAYEAQDEDDDHVDDNDFSRNKIYAKLKRLKGVIKVVFSLRAFQDAFLDEEARDKMEKGKLLKIKLYFFKTRFLYNICLVVWKAHLPLALASDKKQWINHLKELDSNQLRWVREKIKDNPTMLQEIEQSRKGTGIEAYHNFVRLCSRMITFNSVKDDPDNEKMIKLLTSCLDPELLKLKNLVDNVSPPPHKCTHIILPVTHAY